MEITKIKLEKLYLEQGKSVRDIAKIFKISLASTSRLLKRFDIPSRPFSTKGTVGWAKGKKKSKRVRKKISNSHKGKVLSTEHREKVIKTLNHGFGENNPGWKGGKFLGNYVYLRIKGHPNLMSNGYIAEHRYVMEQKIGRCLGRWEHVHHINGIKHDNRPENLELVNAQTHNLITMLENKVRKLEAELKSLKGIIS